MATFMDPQAAARDIRGVPPDVDPLFYAQMKYRRKDMDACIDICSQMLEKNPYDRAVWILKTRALTEQSWIDDTELEEAGVADMLLDDNAMAQAPRPGTSLNRPATGAAGSGVDPAIRPVTAGGRPVTGFIRPGTSTRPGTSSTSVRDAFRGSRPGTSRPMTALGRQVRLGTASMLARAGGPFIDAERLDFRKYARRPAMAKALAEYLLFVDHNPRKAVELAAAATVASGYADWYWKSVLGRCYYQLGLFREAEKQFKSALAQQETVPAFLQLCKVYLRLDQPNTALDTYKRAAESFPSDVSIVIGMARVHEMLNHPVKSIAQYRSALRLDASNVEALASIASHHFYTDQPEVALQYYRRLLQMGVYSAELWNNLGLCCFYASQYDMTLTCFERALAVAEDDNAADVWHNIGQVAMGIGDLQLAYQAFRVAIAANSSHAESYNNLGVLELRKRQAETARSHFQTAQRLADYLFEPQYNGALLAYKLGDFQESFSLVNKALAAYPGHADSHELLKQLRQHFALG